VTWELTCEERSRRRWVAVVAPYQHGSGRMADLEGSRKLGNEP